MKHYIHIGIRLEEKVRLACPKLGQNFFRVWKLFEHRHWKTLRVSQDFYLKQNQTNNKNRKPYVVSQSLVFLSSPELFSNPEKFEKA